MVILWLLGLFNFALICQVDMTWESVCDPSWILHMKTGELNFKQSSSNWFIRPHNNLFLEKDVSRLLFPCYPFEFAINLTLTIIYMFFLVEGTNLRR